MTRKRVKIWKIYDEKQNYFFYFYGNCDIMEMAKIRFKPFHERGHSIDSHWHNCLKSVYMLEGRIALQIPERSPLPIKKDEFYIVYPMEIHSVKSEKNEAIALQRYF